MFRVYKPKNIVRIKAVQVTEENCKELANLLMGRVLTATQESHPPKTIVIGIEFPTLQGTKAAEIGKWITRTDDNVLEVVEDAEFSPKYEVARNTNGS